MSLYRLSGSDVREEYTNSRKHFPETNLTKKAWNHNFFNKLQIKRADNESKSQCLPIWYSMVVFEKARICPIKRVVVVLKRWTCDHVLYIKEISSQLAFKQFFITLWTLLLLLRWINDSIQTFVAWQITTKRGCPFFRQMHSRDLGLKHASYFTFLHPFTAAMSALRCNNLTFLPPSSIHF